MPTQPTIKGSKTLTALLLAGLWGLVLAPQARASEPPQGIVYNCQPAARAALPRAMAGYLRELDVDRDWIVQTESPDGTLSFTLDRAGTNTLNLPKDKTYRITPERLMLPDAKGKQRAVRTVSKREILLAQRQNIVAWAEELHWVWPDGGDACWNPKKWRDGTPTVPLDDALLDAFTQQAQYAIGCYTASKLTYAHGVLDYYARVLKDPAKAALVRQRLLHDGDPLVGVEPPVTWDFEKEFDPATRQQPGKLLRLVRGVPPRHFVPGDWAYLLNTDPVTYEKTGYEGSNAIYLGRGRFDDYYDDHNHSYTFEEKLDEVYQWRNGVFSRSRDAALVRPLSADDYERLSRTPAQGGLLLDLRLEPYLFGFEVLPPLPGGASK